MSFSELWSLLGNIVTVFGLPMAIYVFVYEQHKARDHEEQEVYQLLSDEYTDFLRLVLDNPDLKLRSQPATRNLSGEQRERMLLIFDILISLFERAYLLAYAENMSSSKLRRWHSWDDYMREWCRREDFRSLLPELLSGEDPGFVAYIRRLAEEVQPCSA